MTAFVTVFLAVFFAELGDKTQIATLLFASDNDAPKWLVFAGASSALIVSTGIAVLAGEVINRHFATLPLKLLAGIGFVVIGGLLIGEHLRAT